MLFSNFQLYQVFDMNKPFFYICKVQVIINENSNQHLQFIIRSMNLSRKRLKTLFQTQNVLQSPLKRQYSKVRINTLQSQINIPSKLPRINSDVKLVNNMKPFKQYQTKLTLSSQCWIAYDLQKDSYKRGWARNKSCQFNGMIRLTILYILCCGITQKFKMQTLKATKICIKTSFLSQNQKIAKAKSVILMKQLEKQRKIKQSLHNNTILGYIDLISSMFISGADDLMEYAIIYSGYIIDIMKKKQELQPLIQIHKVAEANYFIDTFNSFSIQLLRDKLGLTQTKIETNFQMISSSYQVCILARECIKNSIYMQLIITRNVKVPIKYQTANNYWQNRQIIFRNSSNLSSCHHLLHYRGVRNFSAVFLHQNLRDLIILADCKVGMVQPDIKTILNWIETVNKPIVNKSPERKKTVSKLQPLIFLLDKQIKE